MTKLNLAVFLFPLALGALHCGGDDSSTGGGSGGSAGRAGTGGNASTSSTTSGSAGASTSTNAGSGGASGSTGSGGAGGGLFGDCPPNKPADGSPCPDMQFHACQFGSTFCGCGAGRPWTCADFDGGFNFDGGGFNVDGFGFGG